MFNYAAALGGLIMDYKSDSLPVQQIAAIYSGVKFELHLVERAFRFGGRTDAD